MQNWAATANLLLGIHSEKQNHRPRKSSAAADWPEKMAAGEGWGSGEIDLGKTTKTRRRRSGENKRCRLGREMSILPFDFQGKGRRVGVEWGISKPTRITRRPRSSLHSTYRIYNRVHSCI